MTLPRGYSFRSVSAAWLGLIGMIIAPWLGSAALKETGNHEAAGDQKKHPTVKPEKAKPAKLKVSGYGFLGNRNLRRLIRMLVLSGSKPEFFDANFAED